ncbi:MAG TPA: aminotransferase [Novosphingobium sp.]|nr:aminotransferase [Novosphingobium sp.]
MTQTTIFERMSRAAAQAGAINLGQGYPELAEPAELVAAACAALRDRSNQYPPMRGLASLREAVAAFYRDRQGLDVTAQEVIITSGATEALAAAILALVGPGDEAVLVQPLYDAYLPLVEWAGGTARLVDLSPPGWTLSLEALAGAITPRTRVIVLNTPNNPTGTMLDADTLAGIGQLCAAHDLTLICDEVWEAMVWQGAHVSPLAIPALRERTVKIGSAGKIFSMTGWKVGWAVAAPALAERIAARHQFLTFTTATPLQWAVADGLALPPAWHEAQHARYAALRARLVSGLGQAGYAVLPNEATWFVTIDLAASGLAIDDVTFCERSIPEAGVAAIPISAFYADRALGGYVRLCFTKEAAVLDAAVEKLAAFRQRLLLA